MAENLFYTEAQSEFLGLFDALKKQGVNQTDLARLIGKDKGSVSRYVSGSGDVPESVLIILRQRVKGSYPEVSDSGLGLAEEDIAFALRAKELRESDPVRHEALKVLIGIPPQRVDPPPKPTTVKSYKIGKLVNTGVNSSAVRQAALSGAANVAAKILANRPKGSSISPEAGEHTAHKPEPSQGTRKPTKTEPKPPSPAPK